MSRPRNVGIGADMNFEELDPARKGEQILLALMSLVEAHRPGDLLPSERVLAEGFGVARMTVRQCLEELGKRHLVRRVPGRGTFVNEPRLVHSEVFRSFSEDMRLRGMEPGSRAVTVRVGAAGPEAARGLGIKPDERAYFVERIRTADGQPIALERTAVPFERFPGLDSALGPSSSLYELLSKKYGVQLVSAEQRVQAVVLGASDARRIDCRQGDAALLIERASRDSMGSVIEFGTSLYRADRYEILMRVDADVNKAVAAADDTLVG